MLLTHHAILNPADHYPGNWTKYLYQLSYVPEQQTNLILATHAILVMALLPSGDRYAFQKLSYEWIGQGDANELTRVNGALGTSRRMLSYQFMIRKAIKVTK